MKKRVFYTEWAYVLGLAALALGTALMEAADFGVSMVVAPAYLVYLKLSGMEAWSFVTFGVAEYLLQFALLVLLIAAVRSFRISYLFAFVTALIYGAVLDGMMALVALLPMGGMAARAVYFTAGLLICSMGVSLMFHTYIAPEVYELFVKELSARYHLSITRVKTAYDCISCLAAVVLSFAFFGFGVFEGVKWGTVVCALLNGWTIGRFTHFFEAHWRFEDGLKLRRYFL